MKYKPVRWLQCQRYSGAKQLENHPFYIDVLAEPGAPATPTNSVVVSYIDNVHLVSWTPSATSLPMPWVVQECDADGKRTPNHSPGIIGGGGKWIRQPSGWFESDISSEACEGALQIAFKIASGRPIYIELLSRNLGFGLFRVDVEPKEREQRETLTSKRIKIAAFDEARNGRWHRKQENDRLKRIFWVWGASLVVGVVVVYLINSF